MKRNKIKRRPSLVAGLPLLWGGTFILAGPYAPPAGQTGSTAVANSDPSIVGWASAFSNYQVGPSPPVDPQWQDPTQALYPAEGNSFNIVSLGDHGQITLSFPSPIADGPGFDFAVYENSFNDTFLELAYVEASPDGVNFVRFPSASLTPGPVGFIGASVDATNIDGLAGKYRQGFGTPFDLSTIGLTYAKAIRIVDVVGDGSCLDSSGRVIYDPYPTAGSVGFDLDGAAALHFSTVTHTGSTGNWTNAPDWDLNYVPNGPGALAAINCASASKTISLDVPVTVASLTFDDAGAGHSATIAGPSALTFAVVNGNAAITVKSGSHAIDAPVTISNDTQISIGQPTNTTPAALTISSPLSAIGATLRVSSPSGTGSLVLCGIQSDALIIDSGTVRLTSANANTLSSLSISAPGKLDVTNTALVVNYGDDTTGATRDTIRNLLKNGRNAGAAQAAPWNGPGGIVSSTANQTGNGFNLAIGYADNADLATVRAAGSYTAFGGQTVASTTILVQLTRGADATLDGIVDGQDVAIIGTHFQKPSSGQWCFGDFDYSGTCDGNDVAVLGTTFGKTSPALSPAQMTAEFGAAFTSAFEAGQAGAVPEPTGLIALLLPIAAMQRRRRQSSFPKLATQTRRFMKMRYSRFIAFTFIALIFATTPIARATTVDFEDLAVPPAGYYNGSDSAGGFTSRGVQFNNTYDTTFASWAGFAYSDTTDTTTPGFGNQYSAIAGSGAAGSPKYAIGYDDGFNPAPLITLPSGASPVSMMITNTTYAYLSMKNGDQFAKKFGGPTGNDLDWFKLTILGLNNANQQTGFVDFFLADFRFPDNTQDYILNTWTPVDLSPLAGASKITFAMTSTDNSFGFMNTPAYFAMDNLVLTPEPGASALVLIGLVTLCTIRNRRPLPALSRS